MPPAGTAAFAPSANNYGPTGATQIAQIAIPQEMLASGVNTNDLNSVVWTVWNDIYTNTISITSNSAATTPNIITSSTSLMTQTTAGTNAAIWGAWNIQLSNTFTQHIGQTVTAATMSAITTDLTNVINQAAWGNWNLSIENMRNASAEQVRAVQERQRQAQEQQQRYQADQARVQVERSLAERRAEKLLQETLSAAQREELASKGFFTLKTIAASGEERIYRIKRGRSRNVEQVDANGNRIKYLCAHPIAQVPDADTMLAQKLMLETDEGEFLRIANHS